MNLSNTIKKTFGWRPPPKEVLNSNRQDHSEDHDAVWFLHRDWHDVTWQDWETHRLALFLFNPEAFRYFLPSILILSLESPKKGFMPVDSILTFLDCSPTPEYWSDFILDNFTGFTTLEYEVMTQWLLTLAEKSEAYEQRAIGRAFDTIVLLQELTRNSTQPL
jgi:hypothetical protein